MAKVGLELFQVDELGLDKLDRAILEATCCRFGGGPVGLSTLAVAVGEAPETVEDVYEPFLLQLGMLMRTPRGRVATPLAWQHLGLPPPAGTPGPVRPSRRRTEMAATLGLGEPAQASPARTRWIRQPWPTGHGL